MPATKLQRRFEQPPESVRPDLWGVTWTLQQFADQVGRDSGWLVEHVLKPNEFDLSTDRDGPVRFSSGKGSPWKIKARPMAYWIEKNWDRVQGSGWN